MKGTPYFWKKARRKHPEVKLEWIQRVLSNPELRETQSDGLIRLWGRIEERKGKYLLVITLPDGVTVHNAYLDHRILGSERPSGT